MKPTLAGFIVFIRTVMGIDSTILPDASPVIPMAYTVAATIVNPQLTSIGTVTDSTLSPTTFPTIYALAVYNLAADNLVRFAPDQPGAPVVPGGEPPLPYFANLRRSMKLTDFTPGVVSSSSDEGTSTSLLNQDFMRDLTLSQLQNLKTPWGLQYLALAQTAGPLWGLT